MADAKTPLSSPPAPDAQPDLELNDNSAPPQQAAADSGNTQHPESDGEQMFTIDYVKELRDEAKKYRIELREVQQQLKTFETAQQKAQQAQLEADGEYEKAKGLYEQRIADLEKQLEAQQGTFRRNRLEQMVISEASKANAWNPLDPNFLTAVNDIDPDESGAVQQVAEAIAALRKTSEYLFKPDRQQTPNLQQFNPGGNSTVNETDRQRLTRLQRQAGQVATIFDR